MVLTSFNLAFRRAGVFSCRYICLVFKDPRGKVVTGDTGGTGDEAAFSDDVITWGPEIDVMVVLVEAVGTEAGTDAVELIESWVLESSPRLPSPSTPLLLTCSCRPDRLAKGCTPMSPSSTN